MAFQFNGLSASVEISGEIEAKYPIPDGTTRVQKQIHYAAAVNNTSATIYTVTSSKTLWITTMTVTSVNDTVGVYIKDNATSIWGEQWNADNVEQMRLVVFPTPIKFTHSIVVTTNANTSIIATFVGWEE